MLDVILEFIGYGIVGVIVIFVILNLVILLKKYRDTKNTATLYFAIGFIFFLGAVATLFLEQICLGFLERFSLIPSLVGLLKPLEFYARLCAVIALILSGTAIVFINLFAFENTFSEKKVPLTIIVTIFTIMYVSLLTFANINGYCGGPLAPISQGEIVYDNVVLLFMIPCTIVIGVAAPGVFYYFSITTWSSNKPNAKRSLWMGIAITCFVFGYVIEVASVAGPQTLINIAVVIGRSLMLSAAIILYVCFRMPDWFKARIGWIEE
ncbi:MAG: hypothetical protein ACTSRW_12195 [Candidatus Helarchaeota archaeon]